MIGRLRGQLVVKRPPHLLLDVNGVGYEVEAPLSTIFALPALGDEVMLHTHLAVRDDAQTLYGFASEAERSLFRTLIKVSGVGAKLALAILSGASIDEFARWIHNDDVAALVRLPGIGRKTAQRLIVEMRDRLPEQPAEASQVGAGGGMPADVEAREALIALGFKPAEAARRVREIDTEGLSTEEIIRRALQFSVRG